MKKLVYKRIDYVAGILMPNHCIVLIKESKDESRICDLSLKQSLIWSLIDGQKDVEWILSEGESMDVSQVETATILKKFENESLVEVKA